MMEINAIAGWIGIMGGVVSGAVTGLAFHEDHWLGGYGSWRRRMVRLGHIAFFGIGILNILFAVTVVGLHWPAPWSVACWALAITVGLMPGACYLAAWRKPFRRMFFVPVMCVLLAVLSLLIRRIVS